MKQKKKQPRGSGGVHRPDNKPVLDHPDKPGVPRSPSGPDFGQSIEAGGMD
jgi:hypothetical protein